MGALRFFWEKLLWFSISRQGHTDRLVRDRAFYGAHSADSISPEALFFAKDAYLLEHVPREGWDWGLSQASV